MLKGLTLPNREYDPYTSAEIAAIEDLQPEVLVWILYDDIAVNKTHEQQLAAFIATHPTTRIIYRPYADNIPRRDPGAWAQECLRRFWAMKYLGEVICDNERNLLSEGGDENWLAHASWLHRFAIAFGNHANLHMGALSPSGNYLKGLQYYLDHNIYDFFNYADWHVYNEPQLEVALEWQAGLKIPSCVTEFNRVEPITILSSQHFDTQRKMTTFESASWFLVGGTPDQAAYDILKQPEMYAAFKAVNNGVPPRGKTFDVGPGVMNLMEDMQDSPTDDEHYLVDAKGQVFMSVTEGKKGKYYWNKSSGQVSFVKHDSVLT